jgi:hypothetical protein
MNESQNWTQLIFERAGVKSKVRQEKKDKKEKKVHCSPIASSSYTCVGPQERGWFHTYKAIAEGRCARDAQRMQAFPHVSTIFF